MRLDDRVARAVLGAALLAAWFAEPAVADPCPNAAVRAQQGVDLPDCRAYEQVSPVDKNGVDVQEVTKQTPDGRAIAWESLGAYGDPQGSNAINFYTGRRTPSGWTTSVIAPRYGRDVPPDVSTLWGANELDENLTQLSFVTWGAFDPLDQDSNGFFGATDVYRVTADGETAWISRPVDGSASSVITEALLSGTSADGSTLFFYTSERLDPEVPDGNVHQQLYRWRDGQVELVGRDANGDLLPFGSRLGAAGTFAQASGNGQVVTLPDASATSRDGSRFAYRAGVDSFGGPWYAFDDPGPLYLHRDGRPPVEVSRSQRAGSVGDPAPTGVLLMATLDDVRKLVLISPDQLTDDAPVGGGYYLYDVPAGTLRFLQASEIGRSSVIAGLTKIDDTGRYLYFVSTQALAPGAQAGEPNLYSRSPAGLRFIATVTADDGLNSFPLNSSYSTPAFTRADISDDGTKLVFETVNQATAAPNGGVAQVYLYDAAADELRCLSCSPVDGSTPALGTLDALRDINNVAPPAMTADGRAVYFTSASPLVEGDGNGKEDVYEYRDGKLTLLSTGRAPHDTKLVGLSPDGADVYVMTREALAPSDVDNGLIDLYDVRVNGGFLVPDPPAGCYGAECQGQGQGGGGGGGGGASTAPPPPSGAPAAGGTPPRATLTPPPAPDVEPAAGDATVKIAAVPRGFAATLAGEGSATVRVRVSRAGTVRVVARARVQRRLRRIAVGSAEATERGTLRVTLELTRAGRRLAGDLPRLRLTASLDRGEAVDAVIVGPDRRAASSTTRNGR